MHSVVVSALFVDHRRVNVALYFQDERSGHISYLAGL